MPKLSDIKIDTTRFKGKGLRPWIDEKNVVTNTIEKNRQQTSNKPTTNWQQTDNKSDNKPTTNRQHN